MAWLAPPTVVAGQLMTAVFWNLSVRDNTAALRGGAMAIAGQTAADLILASSSTQWSRLAPVAGQVPRRATTWAMQVFGATMWPVGSIYRSTISVYPAALLGFGTWVPWGAGRTPVVIDAGQAAFDTVEETGGAKTHTLTLAEMAVHSHPTADAGHAHLVGTKLDRTGAGDFKHMSITYPGPNGGVLTSTSTTGITIGSAGGGGAHTNLNEYVVIYMWKRTA